MDFYNIIISRRTIRSYKQKPVDRNILEKLVNAARLAPTAANKQPLEFVVIDDKDVCLKIFNFIKLAGSLEWKPKIDEMPTSYIVILANKTIRLEKWIQFDAACAAENVCIAAQGFGLGSCMIGAFDEVSIKSLLNVPIEYDIVLLTALGFPAHSSVIEDMNDNDSKYSRDANGLFHVPKRKLKDVIHYNKF